MYEITLRWFIHSNKPTDVNGYRINISVIYLMNLCSVTGVFKKSVIEACIDFINQYHVI